MKKPSSVVTRRRFLATASVAAAAPLIVPASVLGKGGRPAPSERIVLGNIGMGTIAQGTLPGFLNDERVQVVAISDVNKEGPYYGYSAEKPGGREVGRRMVNKQYRNEDCHTYEDFREMLDKEDIDAVNICTPDHWHAFQAITCANRGVHCYGQKPLCLTVMQGRRMADAVAKNGITWQTGSQQRSEIYFRTAAEYVRNQRLGKLEVVKVGLPAGHFDFNKHAGDQDPSPVPDGMNWELWQGPAPRRAFRNAIHPLNWRNNLDYSGGGLTDWGAHHIDITQWALGKDTTGPVRFENIRGEVPAYGDLYNTPSAFYFECTYADGTRMHVADNQQHKQGIEFIGEQGKTIYVKRGKIETNPVDMRRDKIRDDEIRLYESRSHNGNFIDCIYSGKPTVAPIEAAHRTITIAHLGVIALRLGRKQLKWDPVKEQVVGDPEANAMLDRKIEGPFKA